MKSLVGFLLLCFLLANPLWAQEDDTAELEHKLDKTTEELSGLSQEAIDQAASEHKPEALKESFVSNMMTGVMKSMVQNFLKENPFSKMPREEVKAMIELRTNGLPVAALFQKHPKTLEMLIDWIRDANALPKLIGIVNQPDKVKYYSFILIGIFIASFLLNLANSKGNLFKRILKKLAIFAGATVINFTAFFVLFKEELGPTLDIVFKYYHL